MSTTPTHHDGSARQYEIRLCGHLEQRWAAWFDGWILTACSNGTTTISGAVADQAALHGLLQRVRDTGLALVSITQMPPDPLSPSSPAPQQSPTTTPRRTT